jgi:hypothetical protein
MGELWNESVNKRAYAYPRGPKLTPGGDLMSQNMAWGPPVNPMIASHKTFRRKLFYRVGT